MKRTALACTPMGLTTAAAGDTLPVTAKAVFTIQGQEITISQASSVDSATLTALTQITCAAPCLSPLAVAEDVVTLGELDVIDFLSSQVANGGGLSAPKDRLLPRRHAGLDNVGSFPCPARRSGHRISGRL